MSRDCCAAASPFAEFSAPVRKNRGRLAISGLEVQELCADLQCVHATRFRPEGKIDTFSGTSPAAKSTVPFSVDTEDYGALLLRFGGGARGCLHVSQVTAGRKNHLQFQIAGSKASLAWDTESPNVIWIGQRSAPNQQLFRDPCLLSPAAGQFAKHPGAHNEGFPDTFKQLYLAFSGYLEAGDFSAIPTFPTFAEGHREILLCETILQSGRLGSGARVPGTTDTRATKNRSPLGTTP
jgi:predicted dehydrogenase